MNSSILSLTPRQLRRAADIQERIASLQGELNQLFGEAATPAAAEKPKRWTMSAAGRARIAAAARARWAAKREQSPVAKPARKKKRKVSAAGRARLSALAKARWAQAREQGKSRL
jgi:hypothetical protein